MGNRTAKATKELKIEKPDSEFPELLVTVPDAWPYIRLAPLYDVHKGHHLHAGPLFKRHMHWMEKEPYVLSWNGGDFSENVVEGSPGMYSQDSIPDAQFADAIATLKPLHDKLLFAIPGNHEARTFRRAGFDVARELAERVGIPYFPDYCFCTIRWRGLKFRLCAHHGTGAAASPGGQRNAAMKDLPWTNCDIWWTGHLHKAFADPIYRTDYDQRTDRMVSRTGFIIISPSYLRYFGGYAASKRLGPGSLGLAVANLYPNGNIEVSLHAKGNRL